MKALSVITFVPLLLAAGAFAQDAPAKSTPASSADVEALRQQVQSLTEMVKQLQQQVKDQQQQAAAASPAAAAAQPQSSAAPALPENPEPSPAAVAANAAPALIPTDDPSVVPTSASGSTTVNANGAAIATTDSSVVATDTTISTSGAGASATQPIALASGNGGKNYMNISFDSVFSLAAGPRDMGRVEVGDHDPQQRGFNARNTELSLDGAVDPFFEGFANIVLKLDNDAETEIELEEAFLQTTSLPWGLQVKGGQFFAPFGRVNPMHPHTWDFADDPLVHGRILGPDGLRGVGAQVSWTLPLPWYSQLLLAVQNGRGSTGYSFRNPGDNGMFFGRFTTDRELRGLQDFVWEPRFENSFNLSETQTVLIGASGAFGSNVTGAHSRTQIYGGDLLYKWKSNHAEGGFPFVKWQTEAMYRRFEAGRGIDQLFPVAETFHDWGIYSQVVWGFRKGWTAGVRGDYLHMSASDFTDDPDRQTRSRISADLTWYPTEFSKLRLQYNHDFFEENEFIAGRDADSVFLQFEFILGAHGAHKF